MAAPAVTLGGLTNKVLSRPDVSRAAIITAAPTGNPALRELDAQLARELLIVQYDKQTRFDRLAATHTGRFDAVITDPFHTYESSVRCLEVCLRLLRPGGLLLCHDCLPPPDYIAADFVDKENWTYRLSWCGFTFAAFRDVMTAQGAAWCTLEADFGIGVAVAPPGSQTGPALDLASWTLEAERDYETRYLTEPFTMMQTVQAEQWEQAVEALLRGADPTHLAAVFTTWDRLIPGAPSYLSRLFTKVARRLV